MTCGLLPPTDHVVRYCKPSSIYRLIDAANVGAHEILPDAFEFRHTGEGLSLSVNWLEELDSDRDQAFQILYRIMGHKLTLKSTGRFAILNVGDVTSLGETEEYSLQVRHAWEEGDPSHSEISGILTDELQVRADLATLVRHYSQTIPGTPPSA